jgi:hypothetical protein
MTKRIKVTVIHLDYSTEIHYHPIRAWTLLNDLYGDLYQDGKIKKWLLETEDLVGVSI